MEQVKKRGRAFISIVLSMLLVFGGGVYLSSGNEAYAASAVANPTPKIDIAVSVPADYPGTFLDYKAELEEKLIAEGLDPNEFRITSSAVQIDTTDTSDWYVYDHYANDSEASYKEIVSGFTEAQLAKRPFRVDPFYSSCAQYGSGPTTVEFQASQPPKINESGLLKAWKYKNHIWTTKDAAGKASMVFAGYYNNNNSTDWSIDDYMIYPASSDSRRTFSFDVDAKNTHMHATAAAGFLLNAGISGSGDSAIIHGYLLLYSFSDAGSDTLTAGKGTLYVLKINSGVNAKKFRVLSSNTAFHSSNFTEVARTSFDLGTQKRARIYVDLQKDKVTVQQQNYNSDGSFASKTNCITNQTLQATGYNGFGPLVAGVVSGHGCTKCSAFTFADLEMTYEADAFDGLKSSQFYEGADYKYFINLAGTSNDPAIPDPTNDSDPSSKKAFDQGIERLAQNEIFYISNWNDGHVLTSQGVTTDNGLYATSSDSVGQIARYIATNYKEKVAYNGGAVRIQVDKPLANLVVRAQGTAPSATEKDVQALTLHLRHLEEGQTVLVYVDGSKSIASTSGSTQGTIVGYQLRVYDPNNNVISDTAADTYLTEEQLAAKTVEFKKDSVQGRYTFELVVKDSYGQVSTGCQTFLTVYNDTVNPSVEIKGHGRESKVTITLLDHGFGIDSDGITLLPDQGSGVAAYAINDEEPVPVPDNPHEYSFERNLSELEIYKIEVWDECGNYMDFKYNTTRVEFVDENGRRLDTTDAQYATYYVPYEQVTGGGDLGELPEVPASSSSLNYPAGWAQVGGKMNGRMVSENTPIKDMIDYSSTATGARVIRLKPVYTTKTIKVAFNADGGTFADGSDVLQLPAVPEGSALSSVLLSGTALPHKTGYTFDKWVMGAGNKPTETQTAAMVAENKEITTQQAFVPDEDTDVIQLKAVWKVGEYELKFDANGGTLGSLKKRTLLYGDQIKPATETDQAGNPYAGNSLPIREGYIFMGWSDVKQGVLTESAAKQTVDANLTMGEEGRTVYATWKKDTARYIIHFHLDNGADTEDGNETMLNDISLYVATDKKYPTLPTPSRSGFSFKGWYTAPEGAATPGVLVVKDANTNGTAGLEIDLYAQWTANEVKYNVVYYLKQSATDGDYVRSSEAPAKPYTATTGATVELPDDAIRDIPNYWFNADAPKSNHTETLTVKGDGTTQFNLYYDRMLTISTSANEGGTIDAPITLKEGQTAQVKWTVQEGYQVKAVLVDNQLRDDLKNAGLCNFTEPIVNNRSVRVVFEKIPEPTTPTTPGAPVTPPASRKAYTVSTEVQGCGSGTGCSITPTAVYPADSTAVINWAPCSTCKVIEIIVDGVSMAKGDADNPITTTSLDFTGLAADHSVVVKVSGSDRPTLGGSTVSGPANDGYYTVTVNRYGGDGKFWTSSTRTISYASANKNDEANKDNWNFKWEKRDSGDRIYEIRVNGAAVGPDGLKYGCTAGSSTIADEGTIVLGSRTSPRNYVVDVYFCDDDTDFTDSTEWINVTTQIIGGAGRITGGFVAKKEEGVKRDVVYELENNKDPDAADYAFYQVSDIKVTGDDAPEIVKEDNKIRVSLTQDADVKVYVEPVTRQVQTLAVTSDKDGGVLSTSEGGILTASRAIGLHGNFTDITASPYGGYRVGAVEVPVFIKDTQTATVTYTFNSDGTATQLKRTEITGSAASTFSISDMPRLAGGLIANGETLSGDATPLTILSQLMGIEQAWADGTDENAGENVYDNGVAPHLDAAGDLKMSVRNVTANQQVVVYFVAEESNSDTVEEVVEKKDDLIPVTATVVGPSVDGRPGVSIPGAGITGGGYVAKGDSVDLTVTIPAGYKVISVGGEPVLGDAGQPESGRYTFTVTVDDAVAAKGKLDVPVVLGLVVPQDNPLTSSGFKDMVRVTTYVMGYGAVTITPSKEMPAGSNHKVDWSIENVASPMAEATGVNIPYIIKVELDGTAAKRQVDEDGTTRYMVGEDEISTTTRGAVAYTNLDTMHSVTVTSILMNEDTDGDGEPDQNLDTTGDGNPDTNVDTNADGTPDLDVVVPDPENPGKTIKLNEDTDGDGVPDVNIVDADGDGKPDNIDPTTPPAPLPNVNVVVPDPDNPGKTITLNKDTDGDGIPDVNIVDGDGDGVPDPVSPNNPKPPLPNVNVDTNGDDIPDLNIDTTGDGIPDLKIVDGNGDGKPDGISPNNPTPPEPTVNIPSTDPNDPGKELILNQDTDGDGIPDVNVVVPDPKDPTKTIIINKDVDGDGIPDINIDTDGDNIPDVNIDTTGDNVPDRNIDTDGTGVWKPSGQGGNADGIWKPDTNIYYGEEGPYTDERPPVDGNGDGVDDNWDPNLNPYEPQDPGNQDPNDPGNNQGDGNGGTNPGGDNGINGVNNGGDGQLPITGDDSGVGGTGSGWNPMLSQTGQDLSKTADENLPFILVIGAAFVISSLIAAKAMNRRREENL